MQNTGDRILADIGGTNTRYALATSDAIVFQKTYPTSSFPSVEDSVRQFLDEPECVGSCIERAAISVPGPVNAGQAYLTKISWDCNERRMSERLDIPNLYLLNDFDAVARSLNELKPHQLSVMKPGENIPGATKLVIGPGTGLGIAAFRAGDKEDMVVASEGAHSSYAAINKDEIAFLEKFLKTLPRGPFTTVKTENLLSGPGLANIYQVLSTRSEKVEPSQVVKRLNEGDKVAERTVALFSSFFGTVAANMALTFGSVGGVYLTGGVFQKIGSNFRNDLFLERFTDNSNDPCRAAFLAPTPVYAITEETPAFSGLLRFLRKKGPANSANSLS